MTALEFAIACGLGQIILIDFMHNKVIRIYVDRNAKIFLVSKLSAYHWPFLIPQSTALSLKIDLQSAKQLRQTCS